MRADLGSPQHVGARYSVGVVAVMWAPLAWGCLAGADFREAHKKKRRLTSRQNQRGYALRAIFYRTTFPHFDSSLIEDAND